MRNKAGSFLDYREDLICENRSMIRQINIRDGFSLSLMDLDPKRNAFISYKVEGPMISFGCILAGEVENKRLGMNMENKSLINGAGIGGISFFSESKGSLHALPGQAAKILHIHLAPDIFESIFTADEAILPPPLRAIAEGRSERDYSIRNNMPLQNCSVAHDIFNDMPSRILGNVYLEGKAMELIALQIAFLYWSQGRKPKVPALSPLEKKRVLEASRILTESPETPPTLKELSGSVTLSINKLERGFQEVYGMSVFSFLREHKMQKARLLFQQSSMNVSEVAWEVGYVNVSHFGTAFKKRFGLLPKEYIRRIRMN
jgi:AraC-like DNA-binding protein